ncbi:hypothetical protein HQ447_11000 [bacterium]|nr:hypothetical protein [bacterium]
MEIPVSKHYDHQALCLGMPIKSLGLKRPIPQRQKRVRGMTGIADTGFSVAFANRRDTNFPWAFALAEHIKRFRRRIQSAGQAERMMEN